MIVFIVCVIACQEPTKDGKVPVGTDGPVRIITIDEQSNQPTQVVYCEEPATGTPATSATPSATTPGMKLESNVS